ncbi:phage tail protein [Mesorhizobium sp. M0522]|uniref:phage tail protein n=1 Tax=Mesorhizobium sp. M0522 TaxID=2956958 RepID=UPI0033352AC0
MKFVNPRNAPPSEERIPYWNENRPAGLTGAIPPADVFNDPQDEILKVIVEAGLTPDAADKTQLWQALQALIAGIVAGSTPSIEVPPGSVSMFAAATAPTGWLKCNGQAVSRTTYADLYAAIGTSWGAGDAVTTFNVPDFRGEFLRGFDDGRGIDADRVFGSLQDYATARPQNDTVQRIDPLTGDPVTLKQAGNPSPATNPSQVGFVRASKLGERIVTGDFDPGGGGNPYVDIVNVVTGDAETRPRNRAVLYVIKT